MERLSELTIKVRKAVKEVRVDMWHSFPKVIKEIFPKAQIVTDRFHVMKLLIEELKKIARACDVKKQDKLSLILRNRIDLIDSQR
ncbi:transposase [Laspinema olomoucense]|uniref:transposase n=1 Tax=Laspinema olomoucense TaxID=3231600 RepID=UPI0021BAB64C|nr:transposase [Laspinema sp. D3d]MCT7975678.1 transposase [Laspinema sp. D3d]